MDYLSVQQSIDPLNPISGQLSPLHNIHTDKNFTVSTEWAINGTFGTAESTVAFWS